MGKRVKAPANNPKRKQARLSADQIEESHDQALQPDSEATAVVPPLICVVCHNTPYEAPPSLHEKCSSCKRPFHAVTCAASSSVPIEDAGTLDDPSNWPKLLCVQCQPSSSRNCNPPTTSTTAAAIGEPPAAAVAHPTTFQQSTTAQSVQPSQTNDRYTYDIYSAPSAVVRAYMETATFLSASLLPLVPADKLDLFERDFVGMVLVSVKKLEAIAVCRNTAGAPLWSDPPPSTPKDFAMMNKREFMLLMTVHKPKLQSVFSRSDASAMANNYMENVLVQYEALFRERTTSEPFRALLEKLATGDFMRQWQKVRDYNVKWPQNLNHLIEIAGGFATVFGSNAPVERDYSVINMLEDGREQLAILAVEGCLHSKDYERLSKFHGENFEPNTTYIQRRNRQAASTIQNPPPVVEVDDDD